MLANDQLVAFDVLAKADYTKIFRVAKSVVSKTGRPYSVGYFKPEARLLCKAFHQAVVDGQGAGEQFILPKSIDFFSSHLERHNEGAAVIGAVDLSGNILGQAVITAPTDEYSDTGMVDMDISQILPLNTLSVLRSVGVVDRYRGQGIMHNLVDMWIQHAQRNNRPRLLTEVATDNIASWGTFLDKGLAIVGIGADPDDNTAIYNMYANIHDSHVSTEVMNCCRSDLEGQRAFFEKGWKTVGWVRESQQLVMGR